AVGPGEIVDVAKIVNIVVSGKPRDLKERAGKDKIPKPLKPLVLVPATPGLGKESTNEASLGDLFFSSEYLAPHMVVIDPRMLEAEEPGPVVNAAMAALAYSAEAYAMEPGNPLVNTYAYSAMRLIMDNLMDVVKERREEKGRLAAAMERFKTPRGRVALANAAMMGGCVYSNSPPGPARMLGIEASRHCEAPAGVCMGIVLTYALECAAYRQGRRLEKILLPLAGVDGYCGTPEGQRFESAINKIRQIQNALFMEASAPIPRTLEDAEMPRDQLEEIAKTVSRDPSVGHDQDECLLILEHAFEGSPLGK
ncbi:MAG: iron-containing alcohol dehydrogenase, partial [Desulfobacterales bacterium]|nr:iron-containing alcohol dehydrogenase [Desulfobacterales bacterium]